jgi:iron complex outermembrane recepter protein
MSELLRTRRGTNRLELLLTASALALLGSTYGIERAYASDVPDRPTIWIELGAQSEQVSGTGDPIVPPFTSKVIADGFDSPVQLQRALGRSFGGEGRLSFEPENSDWIFSAAVLYGRANAAKGMHEQSPGGIRHASFVTSSGILHTGSIYPRYRTARFSEPQINNRETHTIVDFQAGKDVGLGLFNGNGHSVASVGVRFAQFTSVQTFNILADPDFYFPLDPFHNAKYHHNYAVSSHMNRSFRGVGPSVSWNASAPVLGKPDDAWVSLDWGVNASLLFGRQKAQGHHQSTDSFYKTKRFNVYVSTHAHSSGNPDRSHTVIVPDVGGFAGASFNFSNAKVSLGYRADFFFGAMDGGIDTRKSESIGFHGPFATISIGLGG